MALSFLITIGVLAMLIPYLRKLGAEQTIREDGPVWHNEKGKTPTMGGVGFVLAISVTVLTLTPTMAARGDIQPIVALLCGLSFGFIGFLDDYVAVTKRRNLGLTPKQKVLFQLLAAAAFLAARRMGGDTSTALGIPIFDLSINLGLLYYPASAFIIIGTVNGVNLTDGLDGLCASVTVPVAILFMALANRYANRGLWLVAAALLGGLLGYLPYNLPKAKVFMGDTGAFFLGGLVAAMAFMVNLPVILALCGIVYVLETLSDILQVAYFKRTGGKRLFLMAPLHHHFEMKKYTEKQIDLLFTAISTAGCILAYWATCQFYPII